MHIEGETCPTCVTAGNCEPQESIMQRTCDCLLRVYMIITWEEVKYICLQLFQQFHSLSFAGFGDLNLQPHKSSLYGKLGLQNW